MIPASRLSRVLYVDLSKEGVVAGSEELDRPLGLAGKALALSLLERELDPAVDLLAPTCVLLSIRPPSPA